MDFYVDQFGAVADGKTLNTKAIQAAIDACHEAGGGRVVFRGGVYMSGTIVLKSHVTLHIESDSVLYGSPDCADYPELPRRHVEVAKLPRYQSASLIYAEECHHIGITGTGTIDAHGDAFIEKVPEGETYWMPYRRIDAPTPPRVVFFTGCQHIRVEDVTMTNQPAGWSYWIHDCDYASFHRVKILAELKYPNNDGIHINCSRNVTVSDSIISCGDDSIIVRANSISLAENKVCEKVTVTNCTLTSHSGGIRIGWVNDGIIRNCTFSNLVMTDTTVGISIYMPPKRWSASDFGREDTHIENLSFSNIVMDRNYSIPIYIDIAEDKDTRIDCIRNLYFDHIHARGLDLPYLKGRAERPLENIYFTNCTFYELDKAKNDDGENHGAVECRGKHPHSFFISHVKNFVNNNTTITVE